jgi:hypothetical protein
MLALDIGGTKIAGGLVDADGRLLRHATRPTGVDPFASLCEVVAELEVGAVAGVGIGCAGPIDTLAGTVSPINIPAWRDFPLVERVRELVGAPVALAGDAVCLALGEHWVGAGQGSTAMLGMVVSTGVGGGLVVDGRPFGGRTGNAGHVGHVVVEPDGEPRTCGGHGCVETVASGPNLVRWARARAGPAPTHGRWRCRRRPVIPSRRRRSGGAGRRSAWRSWRPRPCATSTSRWSAVVSRRPATCCSSRCGPRSPHTRGCPTCVDCGSNRRSSAPGRGCTARPPWHIL